MGCWVTDSSFTLRGTMRHLIIHGHFYQPPRDLSPAPDRQGAMGATLSQRRAHYCRMLSSASGDGAVRAYELQRYPTLATWLSENARPDVYAAMLEAIAAKCCGYRVETRDCRFKQPRAFDAACQSFGQALAGVGWPISASPWPQARGGRLAETAVTSRRWRFGRCRE